MRRAAVLGTASTAVAVGGVGFLVSDPPPALRPRVEAADRGLALASCVAVMALDYYTRIDERWPAMAKVVLNDDGAGARGGTRKGGKNEDDDDDDNHNAAKAPSSTE